MNETLYADSSAIVKLYLDEQDSDDAARAMASARTVATSRISFTEVARALVRHEPDGVGAPIYDAWESDWQNHEVIELDQAIAAHAASLAAHRDIRSLDALHLASALSLGGIPLRFATWDRRLARAARGLGLRVVPASLA